MISGFGIGIGVRQAARPLASDQDVLRDVATPKYSAIMDCRGGQV